jgi:hypothetical protein
MKKVIIIFIFIFTLCIAFTSCNNDSNDGNDSQATLEGKWNFSKQSETVSGVTSPEIDFEGNESGCALDYVEFKSGSIVSDGDYSGSTCILELSNGTWAKTGNTVTINFEDDVSTFQIVSISSTTLKIQHSDTFEGVTTIFNLTLIRA